MSLSRRYLESCKLYEACLRVREGLPFTTLAIMNLILEGAMARAQRGEKITVCAFIWMANHLHILFLTKDIEKCRDFFTELPKKITDALKKLLDLDYLHLWEGDPSIAKVLDLEAAIDRIVYIYCNPAKANLVESIEHYPGVSSWKAFSNTSNELSDKQSKQVPWFRNRYLPVLHSRTISASEDKAYVRELLKRKHYIENLDVYPNAWLKSFGITDKKDIQQINSEIKEKITSRENAFKEERKAKRIRVLGAARLAQEPILKPHKPKKSRRIYVISFIKELRLKFIADFQEICATCRELYEKAKKGVRVEWPPGVFPPRIPLLANAISF